MTCSGRMVRALLLVLVLSAGVAAVPAGAHGALHEQIAAVTRQLNQDPKNARLYLKRGELRSDHGEWKAALDDFDRAIELEPGLIAADLARGRTWLGAGQAARAKKALDRFLAREPIHVEALALRAAAHAHLRQWDASVADYSRAIARLAQVGRPNPDYYLQRARVVAERGGAHREEALRGLDEGTAALGPLVSLQLFAIDLELALGRTDAALARLASVAAQSDRPEFWLVRSGDILEQAGRFAQARSAFERAQSAIHRLSPQHRRTRATRDLDARLQTALARMTGLVERPGDGPTPRGGERPTPGRSP